MKTVLATDLDGTLFYPRRNITMIAHRNIAFLRRFISSGGHVILVTSRNRDYTEKVIEKIGYPVDVIGGNGTYIIADGKVIQDISLDNKIAREVFDYIDKTIPIRAWMMQTRDKGIVLYVKDINFAQRAFYEIYYSLHGVYKQTYTFGNDIFFKQMESGQLYSLILYFGVHKGASLDAKKANAYIREHYPSVESSWTKQFIEITPAECNKGEALRRYCAAKGIDHDDVHVVGDSGNDITMFKAFANSYCMGRAAPSVKKYAKHIIKSFSELENYVMKEKEQP